MYILLKYIICLNDIYFKKLTCAGTEGQPSSSENNTTRFDKQCKQVK